MGSLLIAKAPHFYLRGDVLDKYGLSMVPDKPGVKELLQADIGHLLKRRFCWPKDLCKIADFAVEQIRRAELDESYEIVAEAVILAMSIHSGGRGFYMPSAKKVRVMMIRKRIYEDAQTMHVYDVARKYKTTIANVYIAIREYKALSQELTADQTGREKSGGGTQ